MNLNVELKLMRNLVFYHFKDYKKTKLLEETYFKKIHGFCDADCSSILNILTKIKNRDYEYNFASILSIYESIFPTIQREELIISELKTHIEFLSQNKEKVMLCFGYILKNNVFKNLSFSGAVILYNLSFYRKKKYFISFGYNEDEKIRYAINSDNSCEIFKSFLKIHKYNKEYHKKSTIFTIEEIKETIKNRLSKSIIYKYKIKKIYLYGSYAKSLNNEYSDMDFHVTITPGENLDECAFNLGRLFIKIFDAKIDVKTTFFSNNNLSKYQEYFNDEIEIY